MTVGKRWTRDELLLALHLYERVTFGQQHQRHPEIIALAGRLGRTPGSVAMKLNNLTSLDPEERARGVSGLVGASDLDQRTWTEFHAHPEVVEEAERGWLGEGQGAPVEPPTGYSPSPWVGATEAEAVRRVRLAQGYFRRVVLANFAGRCALTGLPAAPMLTASHIVPWADAPELRVAPGNGLCLNRLHDAAFDQKLITFDEGLRLVLGRRLRQEMSGEPLADGFLRYEGVALRRPEKHAVGLELMARHRAAFRQREAT